MEEDSSAESDEAISSIQKDVDSDENHGKKFNMQNFCTKNYFCWYQPATTIFRPAVQLIEFLLLFVSKIHYLLILETKTLSSSVEIELLSHQGSLVFNALEPVLRSCMLALWRQCACTT